MAITSTPSWIAMSKAAMISADWHEPGQQTLYAASLERRDALACFTFALPLHWDGPHGCVVKALVLWPNACVGSEIKQRIAYTRECGDYACHCCRKERPMKPEFLQVMNISLPSLLV